MVEVGLAEQNIEESQNYLVVSSIHFGILDADEGG